MRLDLRKLKRSGKDTTDFYFEYASESNLSDSIPDSKIVLPIKVPPKKLRQSTIPITQTVFNRI